jgi:virginiamycin A acetyltransferase
MQYANLQSNFQSRYLKSKINVAGKAKGDVKVGNSVWIGDSVIILSGVTIGDGAILGAGSIVTKDIPAYAIAVGNPAKVIKYRFSEEVILFYQRIKWWDWSYSKINCNKAFFDIDFEKIKTKELKILESKII